MKLKSWDQFYSENKDHFSNIEEAHKAWAKLNMWIAISSGINQPEGWKTWSYEQKNKYISEKAEKGYYGVELPSEILKFDKFSFD